MKSADLIIVWPTNCEYPLFRSFIRLNRSKFARVIIAFTEVPHGDDFRQFVMDSMKEDSIDFLSQPATDPGDWRNNAINRALTFSDAEWVWFMEQDFLIREDSFWNWVDNLMVVSDVIGVKDGERLHPCCLLIRREILEKTHKDFGIIPDKLDHFGMIQKDLESIGAKIGTMDQSFYHHMAGLSHNYTLAHQMKEITYKLDEFKNYLRLCLTIQNVPLDSRFMRVAKGIVHN